MIATAISIATILAVQLLGLPDAHAFVNVAGPQALARPALDAQATHAFVQVAAASISADVATAPSRAEESTYLFRDQFKIHAEASVPKDGQPVVLIHGFGCSSTYWRATRSTLVG